MPDGATPAVAAVVAALRDRLGERLSTSPSVRDLHGRDMSRQPVRLPDAVAFAMSEADVAAWGTDDGYRRAARLYYEAICEYFGTEALPEA